MAEHRYSLKNFLRLAPKSLLDRYFHKRGILLELNIAALAETAVEPIYNAWIKLPVSERPKIEDEFQMVDRVADEQGIMTILEEGVFHKVYLQNEFAQMPGFHYQALWTFLEHRDWLETAARFREADELPKIYWRECDGLKETSPRDDKAGCEDLANVLKDYFRKKEGRGNACWVDVFRRGPRYYYFAYLEDYSRSIIEFEEEDKLAKRTHRPVFEIVFVYDPGKGKFSTYYHGRVDAIRDLQQIFVREILVTSLPHANQDQRVYNLNPFKNRDFRFRYAENSGIANLRIKLLKFAIIGGGTQRITLDVNPSHKAEALYDLLDEVLNTRYPNANEKGIPISLVNVTKVGIKAYFVSDGHHRRKPTKTFYLSVTNTCTLEHEGRDQVLRQMLIDSGIEPKPPSALQGM